MPLTPADQRARSRGERLQREYLEAESLLEAQGVRQTVVVLGSARTPEKHRYYEMARELGRRVGQAGGAIITGGGPGIMEAANRGAHDAGAPSVGFNITLPDPQVANPYVSPGLYFSFRYFPLRKLHFLLRARALVAFPGGYGTFDELFETLTLVQTRKIRRMPVVLVGEAFWRRAFDVEFLVAEGMIDPTDKELFRFAETAQEIWQCINP